MVSSLEKKRNTSVDETLRRTKGRLISIQKWMGFSNEIFERWQSLATQFIHWTAEKVKRRQITMSDIADQYPVVWSKFLTENNERDDFMVEIRGREASSAVDDVWEQLNQMKIDDTTKEKEKETKNENDDDLSENETE